MPSVQSTEDVTQQKPGVNPAARFGKLSQQPPTRGAIEQQTSPSRVPMRAEYISPVLSGLASLQNYAQQWYLDKGVKWPVQPAVNKIDLHHHFVPDFYAQGKRKCRSILSSLLATTEIISNIIR